MSDYAKYDIGNGATRKTVRVFMRPKDETDLSLDENAAREVICGGFLKLSGRVGVTIDPYKAAESILAEHYGYAKMVEAHYEWEPGVLY